MVSFLYRGILKNLLTKVNTGALVEYECLKQNNLFSLTKRNTISDNTVTALVHKVILLSKYRWYSMLW